MKEHYWLIEGYDSLTKIYERKEKVGLFSRNQIQALLKTLAAREGLTRDEIVEAYARKGTRIANRLLSVRKESRCLSCGENPHFTARIVREDA
jgi:hypothetical protein